MNLEAQRILDKYFSVIPVTEGVYRILIDRLYPVSDLIVGSHHAAVIDGGTGFGNLPSAIRKLTDKPLFIFNTHNHVDHVGANVQFGQPVYMGTEDIPDAVYGNNVDFRRKHLTGRIAQYGSIEDESFDPEEFLHRTAGELLPCDEGDVFDLGGLTLRVYNAPGHSIGSRAFYLEERKILYTGDNAYPCTLLFGYGSVKRQVYLATVDKLLEIPFEVDPTIVRGLDYYRRTVFEFVSDDIGAQSTVCGGGRYDGLVEELGGDPLPGIGFGLGIERLIMSLERAGYVFPELPAVEV